MADRTCFCFLIGRRQISGAADLVLLSNGGRLSGQVISAGSKSVALKTGYACEVTIGPSAIQEIRAEPPGYVTLAGGDRAAS